MQLRGEKITTFGRSGQRRPGSLLGPQYLTLDRRGYLWVTDWGNSRVVRFTLDGTFVQAITGHRRAHGHRRRGGQALRLRQGRQAHPRLRPEREPAFLDRGGDPAGPRGALVHGRGHAPGRGRQPHPGSATSNGRPGRCAETPARTRSDSSSRPPPRTATCWASISTRARSCCSPTSPRCTRGWSCGWTG